MRVFTTLFMIQFEINYSYYWLTIILGIQHHSETRQFCTDINAWVREHFKNTWLLAQLIPTQTDC